MTGERDLHTLLADMEPELRDGFHDHLFVPVDMGAQVLDMLHDLARSDR